ncbi:MAG: hypothetical protein WCT12_23460, partial [Verrucomicrobiota bacterium]
HQQVERKVSRNSLPDAHRNSFPAVTCPLHNNEQIHVGVLRGMAAGLRAEEHNSLGVKLPCNRLAEGANLCSLDHDDIMGRTPAQTTDPAARH